MPGGLIRVLEKYHRVIVQARKAKLRYRWSQRIVAMADEFDSVQYKRRSSRFDLKHDPSFAFFKVVATNWHV